MLIDVRPITYWEKPRRDSNLLLFGIRLRDIRFSEAFRVWRGKPVYEEASIKLRAPVEWQIIDCRWETEMEAEQVCL